MAGGYLLKRILIAREDATGAIPANPTLVEYLSESFDLKEEQASEEINLLGTGGDASPMAFGTSSFTGAVNIVLSTDNAPICLTHTLGDALTSANATSDTWTLTTVYAVGDKVNHSDGKHTLVCYTAGTSGATEPTGLATNPNDDRNTQVTDGTVVWIAMPLLRTDTYELTQQIPTFTIEYELEDASANTFFRRFSNVTMNSLPIAMTGDTISVKVAGDMIGVSASASTDADWVEELSAITGAKIVPAFKNYYSYEDCTVKADDVAYCEVSDVNITTNRNITVDDAINDCKIKNIGVASASGSITRVFEEAVYSSYKAHEDFKLDFDFQKSNGCALLFTYANVRPKLADPDITIDKQTFLTSDISAFGTSTVKSVQATVTYPALFDSATGLIVNTDGSY
jgi:hypothetical protein